MWVLLILFGALRLSNGVPVEEHLRIIGGEAAPQQHAPHMVALLHTSFHTTLVCGGSLVSRRHVLTAAHCITPFTSQGKLTPAFYGRVGSNIWHAGGTVITFTAHHIHPKYDEKMLKYDAGLLVLDEEVELSSRVALTGLEFGWVGGGQKSYVTGWGKTGPRFEDNAVHLAPVPDYLQLLYVRTLTPAQCAESLSDAQWDAAPPLDKEVEICTFHSVGHGMCNGDSGSALVSTKTGLQSGLVSWGHACALGAPDVFTRVSGVAPFIRKILGRHQLYRSHSAINIFSVFM